MNHLSPKLPRIFKKIQTGTNGILRAWGKLMHEKNFKSKILWLCPFKYKSTTNSPSYLSKNGLLLMEAQIVLRFLAESSVPETRVKCSGGQNDDFRPSTQGGRARSDFSLAWLEAA
jgi:hypothetical protein